MWTGCRRGDLEGCLAIANAQYILCRVRQHNGQDICNPYQAGLVAQCQQTYSSSLASAANVQTTTDASSTNSSSEIFDFADSDSCGNITLTEYFKIMGLSMGDSAAEIALRSRYAKFFFR